MKLTRRETVLICVLAALVLLAGSYMLLFAPLREQVAQRQAQLGFGRCFPAAGHGGLLAIDCSNIAGQAKAAAAGQGVFIRQAGLPVHRRGQHQQHRGAKDPKACAYCFSQRISPPFPQKRGRARTDAPPHNLLCAGSGG